MLLLSVSLLVLLVEESGAAKQFDSCSPGANIKKQFATPCKTCCQFGKVSRLLVLSYCINLCNGKYLNPVIVYLSRQREEVLSANAVM